MCNHLPSILPAFEIVVEKYHVNTETYASCGTFGIVVSGEHKILKEEVAFKFECGGTTNTCNESATYDVLKGVVGIPKFYEAGQFREHGILIIELLGCNLNMFMRVAGGSLPIPIIYALGRQLVSDGPSTSADSWLGADSDHKGLAFMSQGAHELQRD